MVIYSSGNASYACHQCGQMLRYFFIIPFTTVWSHCVFNFISMTFSISWKGILSPTHKLLHHQIGGDVCIATVTCSFCLLMCVLLPSFASSTWCSVLCYHLLHPYILLCALLPFSAASGWCVHYHRLLLSSVWWHVQCYHPMYPQVGSVCTAIFCIPNMVVCATATIFYILSMGGVNHCHVVSSLWWCVHSCHL